MSDEIRTTSATGGQKGVKPERHSLIPREGLDAIARVFGFGATKYLDHNWRKGYEWSKSYDALVRHITAFWSGETYDPESGLPHLAHAGFHIFALLTWLEEQGEGSEYDDRYRQVDPQTVDIPLVPGPGPRREYDFSRDSQVVEEEKNSPGPEWFRPFFADTDSEPHAVTEMVQRVLGAMTSINEALQPLTVNIHHHGMVEETQEIAENVQKILDEARAARRARDPKRRR